MTTVRVLDLFSGIGGFARAFFDAEKAFRTVAYCDADAFCRRVIRANIRKGRLHPAPVFEDVRALTGEHLRKLDPKMVTAGFPCQDISIANKSRDGLRGTRSSLFAEVLRIVDAAPGIDYVLLENSNNIINLPGRSGVRGVVDSFEDRGFRVSYVVQSAGECGAPHRRSRWFALAVRDSAMRDLGRLAIHEWEEPSVNWSREPCDRIVPHKDDAAFVARCKRRCSALGNSVVPSAVVRAWNTLLSAGSGACAVPKNRRWNPERRPVLELPDGTLRRTFPTPTFTTWHAYRRFSPRSSRAIGNFLYIEKRTLDQVKKLYRTKAIPRLPKDVHRLDDLVALNPRFVEWLMGYPRDWTAI